MEERRRRVAARPSGRCELVLSGAWPAAGSVGQVDAGAGGLVRRTTDTDMATAGRLLRDFNREFAEPSPPPEVLAERLRQLVAGGDTVVLLAGEDPSGVAVLRLRGAIWSSGLECYLAELYVVPEQRRRGVGRALIQAAIREARERGAKTMDVGVDEPDLAARRLYERMGFTNRTGDPDGSLMYVYERDL